MQQKIRVMVVDDSLLFRTWLIQSLSADPRFEVVGYAVNALDAKNKLPLLKPDIMTMDIEMPGMTGMEFLKEVLPSHPVPVILVSSLNVRVFDALAAGAVDFVRKPEEGQRDAFLRNLMTKLTIGKNARVRLPQQAAVPTAAPAAAVPQFRPGFLPGTGSGIDLIAIGASTG